MAIAFDIKTFGAAYTSIGTQTVSHAADANARAAIVLITQNGSTADQISGVTYAGVTMNRLRSDTESTEAGRVFIYWLDGIAGGTQDVAMTSTGTNNKRMEIVTVTVASGYAVSVVGTGDTNSSASGANPSLTITGLTNGVNYFCVEVIHSGLTTMTNTPQTTPAWTLLDYQDIGAQGRGYARYTGTASGTSITAGWIAATADDYVISGAAFYEVSSYGASVDATAVSAIATVPSGGGSQSTPVYETSSNSSFGFGSLSAAVPSGAAAGDVMVAIVYAESSATHVAPDGNWTRVGNQVNATSHQTSTWWKRLTAADSGTYTWTGPSGSVWCGVMVARFSNVIDTDSPIDNYVQAADSGITTTSPANVYLTPNSAPTYAIALASDFGGDSSDGTVGPTSPDSSWTAIQNPNTSNDDTVIWGHTLTTTDEIGPVQVTSFSSGSGSTIHLITLIGASAAGEVTITTGGASPDANVSPFAVDAIASIPSVGISTKPLASAVATIASVPTPTVTTGAVTFDAVGPSSSGQFAYDDVLSWSHTMSTADGGYLIVGVALAIGDDSGYTMSATYGGQSMQSLGIRHSQDATAGFVQVWGLSDPPTGTNTVTVTANGVAELHGGSISFTGVGSIGEPTTTASTSERTSVSIPLSSPVGDMVVSVAVAGSPFNSISGGTLAYEVNVDSNTAAGNIQAGYAAGNGGTVTITHNHTSDWDSALAVNLSVTTSGDAFVSPAAVAGIASIPSVGINIKVNATSVTSIATVPSVGISTKPLVGAVTAIASVPTVGLTAGLTVLSVNAAATIPSIGISTKPLASAITAVANVPSVSISTGLTVSTVNAVASIPSVGISTKPLAIVVVAIANIPNVGISTKPLVESVTAIAAIPAPTPTVIPGGVAITTTAYNSTILFAGPNSSQDTGIIPSGATVLDYTTTGGDADHTATADVAKYVAGDSGTEVPVGWDSGITGLIAIEILGIAGTRVSTGSNWVVGSVDAISTVPTPSVFTGGDSHINAEAVNAVSTVPSVGISAGLTVSAVSSIASIPAVGISTKPLVLAVSAVATVPSVGISGGPLVSAVVATVAVPSVGISTGLTVGTVSAVASIPSVGISTKPLALAVGAVATIPAPYMGQIVKPNAVTSVATIPVVGISTGLTVVAVNALAAVPIVGVRSNNVWALAVTAIANVPEAHASSGIAPLAINAIATIPRPGLHSLVLAVAVPAVASVPAVTIPVYAKAVTAVATVPSVGINIRVFPGAVIALANVPTVSISAIAIVASISAIATIPAVGISVVVNASAVAASVAITQVAISATLTVGAVTAVVSIPVPGVGQVAQPASVNAIVAIPTVSISAGLSVLAVGAIATIPAVAVVIKVQPSAVTALASVPAVAKISVTHNAVAVNVIGAVPTPTVVTQGNVSISVGAVTTIAAIPSVKINVIHNAVAVNAITSVPSPTVKFTAQVVASAVPAVASIPFVSINIVVHPDAVVGIITIPGVTPTASSQVLVVAVAANAEIPVVILGVGTILYVAAINLLATVPMPKRFMYGTARDITVYATIETSPWSATCSVDHQYEAESYTTGIATVRVALIEAETFNVWSANAFVNRSQP